jgi:hypothetical protein
MVVLVVLGCRKDQMEIEMAKKAKRLVSESRTQLIDCCRLLHIALFRRALAHFPQSPDHRPSIAAMGAGHNFAAGNAQAVISQR